MVLAMRYCRRFWAIKTRQRLNRISDTTPPLFAGLNNYLSRRNIMADTAQLLENLIGQIEKDILELEQGAAIFSKPPHQDEQRMEWCIKTAVTFRTTKEAPVKLRGQF